MKDKIEIINWLDSILMTVLREWYTYLKGYLFCKVGIESQASYTGEVKSADW